MCLGELSEDLLTVAELVAVKSLTPSIKELCLRVDPSSGARRNVYLSFICLQGACAYKVL